MVGSYSKKLLGCLVFLWLSGCGAPSGGGSSTPESTNNSDSVPTVEVVREDGSLKLEWNDTEAYQYRVLYWQGNDAPFEFLTNNTTYTFPPLASGEYTILVEAYDQLGNSFFSAPAAVEVF